MLEFNDIHDAYTGVLKDIYTNPDYKSSPRGLKIREIMHYQFRVTNPKSEPIITHDGKRNAVIKSYTERELEWYKSGSILVDDASKISQFWSKLANPDNTINSNYGHLVTKDKSEGDVGYEYWEHELMPQEVGYGMRTPWEWAKHSLMKDLDTRQAVVRFNKPKHCWNGNKDFVCTMFGNFHVREGKLMFVVRMRSTDMHYGLVFDMPYFIHLQEQMLKELQDAGHSHLEMGSFTFSSDSIHIYETSFNVVERMLGIRV